MKANRRVRICILMSASAIGLTACVADRPMPGEFARQWSDSIAELGIRPIYPPREDVYVGDLYIVRVHPTDGDPKQSTALYREPPTFVVNFDLRPGAHYANRPSLPLTPKTARPKEQLFDEQPSTTAFAEFFDSSLKKTDALRTRLVAFPGYYFASVRQAQVTAGVPTSGFAAALGFESNDDWSLSVSVPRAESYAVSGAHAYKRLSDICSVSGELVEPVLNAVATNENTTAKDSRAVKRVAALVTEVFMARQIQYEFKASASMGAQLSAVVQQLSSIDDKAKQLEVRAKQLQSVAAQKPGSKEAKEAKDAAAAAAQEAAGLRQDLRDATSGVAGLSAPGGSIGFVSANARGITLSQTFERPIAIGYRGLVFDLRSEPKGKKNKDSRCGLVLADIDIGSTIGPMIPVN